MQQKFPEIPDDAFEAEKLNRAFEAMIKTRTAVGEAAAEALPGDVWNCMVRHLGFWGALMVVAVAAVVITVFAAVVIFGLPVLSLAVWDLFWFHFWAFGLPAIGGAAILATVGIILSCVVNPSA